MSNYYKLFLGTRIMSNVRKKIVSFVFYNKHTFLVLEKSDNYNFNAPIYLSVKINIKHWI